jgi:hypothetical protein
VDPVGKLPTDPHTSYERLAAELATMPDVIERLLRDHVPDASGRCVGCTRGGTGYPAATSPCSLARLAMRATEIRQGTR